jgi:hypothetical protein
MVEPGHTLDGSEGRVRKFGPARQVVADFGTIPQRPPDAPLMPGNVSLLPGKVPALGSGWIVYAGWTNNTGSPIATFRTTWVVPPQPATQSGQTIFLFNGIQNSTMIYQPVLQWGPSAAGGGNFWAVASWYADGQGGQAFHSQLIPVAAGAVLIGVMQLTGQSGSNYSYNCSFQGIANTQLPIQNVEQLTWANETLEAYGLTVCSDYPNTDKTGMTAISLQTNAGNPPLAWSPVSAFTDCGQSCVVVSNSPTNGEVDLFYRIPLQWLTNVTVNQTFATRDSQNAWAYFQGYGWRKIQPGAPDGITDMLTLFAQAVAKNHPVTVYADGNFVYQAYL